MAPFAAASAAADVASCLADACVQAYDFGPPGCPGADSTAAQHASASFDSARGLGRASAVSEQQCARYASGDGWEARTLEIDARADALGDLRVTWSEGTSTLGWEYCTTYVAVPDFAGGSNGGEYGCPAGGPPRLHWVDLVP